VEPEPGADAGEGLAGAQELVGIGSMADLFTTDGILLVVKSESGFFGCGSRVSHSKMGLCRSEGCCQHGRVCLGGGRRLSRFGQHWPGILLVEGARRIRQCRGSPKQR
jgi:hypothetical protein